MKKLSLLVLGSVAAAVVGYGAWTQIPSLAQPGEVKTTRKLAQKRWEEARLVARDPAQNAYINPRLRPFWGSQEHADVQSPDYAAVSDWLPYADPSETPKPYESLVKDPEYRKALAGIESLERDLQESMRRPFFMVPESKEWNFGAPHPNFIAPLNVAKATVALAKVRLAQGNASQGVSLLGGVVRFGRALSGYNFLLQDSISVRVQEIASGGYLSLFPPEAPLTATDWQELATSFVAAIPPRNQLAVALENDMASGLNSLDTVGAGASLEGFGRWPWWLPGYMGREKRVYANAMMGLIASAREGSKVNLPEKLAHPTVVDYLRGNAGQSTDVLLPDVSGLQAAFEYNRKRTISLALLSATRAFVSERGRLPKDLTEVRKAGIAVPEPSAIGADAATWTSNANGVLIEASYPPHQRYPRDVQPWKSDWADESQDGKLVYRVVAVPALSKR